VGLEAPGLAAGETGRVVRGRAVFLPQRTLRVVAYFADSLFENFACILAYSAID
jgi:hypothetical protein